MRHIQETVCAAKLDPIDTDVIFDLPGQFFSSCLSLAGRVRLSPGASAGSVRLGSSLVLQVGEIVGMCKWGKIVGICTGESALRDVSPGPKSAVLVCGERQV